MIDITEHAAQKVKLLLQEQGKEGYGLRVFVQGGGCSGFQYGLAFEENLGEGDAEIESHGVKLYVDPQSAMYLTGSVIDYEDNLYGGGFKVNNPNATATCGCGHSFSA
jgi:iron-sulfur cluster insertion protein